MTRRPRAGWLSGFISGIACLAIVGFIVAVFVVPINVGAPSAGAQVQATEPASLPQTNQAAEPIAVSVVRRVSPAVVTVINQQVASEADENDPADAGVGTGFIIDNSGHIVTNWHVIADGDRFVVLLSTGEQRDADLVGFDSVSDLAVLDMDGDVPATVPFGDSDALQPGETVLAIGSPLGAFTNTVTEGIVSALGRSGADLGTDGSNQVYSNLIQHDAAINPGNSGGPLFNLQGEVVGVNTLGLTQSGDGRIAQGLFFAVPSSTVQDVSQRLIDDGKVVYPRFGVATEPITPHIAAQNELPVTYGAFVTDVGDNSGAEDAGVRVGDIILEIDGQPINFENPFVEVLFDHEPGETVDVLIQRGDEQFTVQVTLGERPNDS